MNILSRLLKKVFSSFDNTKDNIIENDYPTKPVITNSSLIDNRNLNNNFNTSEHFHEFWSKQIREFTFELTGEKAPPININSEIYNEEFSYYTITNDLIFWQ